MGDKMMFTYTEAELDHLQDLQLRRKVAIILFSMGDNYDDPARCREEAARLREEGPWADAENGPSPDDLAQPTPEEFEEEADEIECGMWRGEHL